MDPKDVLSNFMETCHTRNEYFQYSLASNAVLDWFGRTIKGNECIDRFLRCDVWPQYDQNFVAAVNCAPIETRSTHEQAKETPIENAIVYTSSAPEPVPLTSGYDSPPPSKRNLDKPPPLHRNKRYKKRAIQYNTASSSSDDECETDQRSYNLRRFAGAKSELKSTQQQQGRTLRKRAGDTKTVDSDDEDRSTSPMKRSKKMLDGVDHMGHASSSGTANCSTQPMPADFSKSFSELKYLESIGSIRTIRRAKHPGINRVPTTKAITATPFVSPESQNGWDRKTKLKISYRTGLLKKNDIQFALIIYEPLTMVTRRNLLEEFQRAALEEDQQRQTKLAPKVLFSSTATPTSTPPVSLDTLQRSSNSINLKTPTMRNRPKNEKISSLRRLRF